MGTTKFARSGASRLVAAFAVVVAGTGLAVSAAQPARAATISLDNCSNSGWDVFALWDAIIRANNETDYPGTDTIHLAPGCTYTLVDTYPSSGFALPAITSAVTIVGRGATLHAVQTEANHRYGIFDVQPGAGLIVTDATLTNWRGTSDGSYFRNAGDVLLVNTTIAGDKEVNAGPAVVNRAGANFTLLRSVMKEIHHGADFAPRGAAIHNEGTLFVVDSDLRDNNVMNAPPGYPQLARAVTNTGHLEIVESYVRRTEPPRLGSVVLAAGIDNKGSMIVRRSQISGFRARMLRGAGINNSGTLTVEESTFEGNHSVDMPNWPGLGGAVYNTGSASFLNTTFWNNHADTSGGALHNIGSATFTHSTLDGSKIRNDDSSGFTTLTGSILDECVGTMIDGGSNLANIATGGCPGTIAYTPLWPWPQQGGTRKGAVLRPQAGGPAIDAASISTCPSGDQRGMPRPRGGACDIGAFENQLPASPSSLVVSQGADPSNTGNLSLDWPDSSDADGDAVSYRLYVKDYDDASEALHATTTTSSASLTSLAEGTYRFRVDAHDSSNASSTSASRSVVVDLTAPTSPGATPDRAPDYVATDGTGWYRDQVDIAFTGSTDPVLADGSKPSGVEVITPRQLLSTSGAHAVSGTAADAAGNVSPATTATFHVDADPPVVGFSSCPSSVVLGSAERVVWTASDAHSGLATGASGEILVDTSSVGSRTLTASATDNVGHSASATCTINVIYDFTGFFAPVVNAPAFNSVSAGQMVRLGFSLGGDQGLDVVEPGYPASAPIACDSTELLSGGESTTSPRGLIFGGDRYTYQWRTSSSWAGTCRQFVLLLDDGTLHRANFSFR
jgi:hypothetical protein